MKISQSWTEKNSSKEEIGWELLANQIWNVEKISRQREITCILQMHAQIIQVWTVENFLENRI